MRKPIIFVLLTLSFTYLLHGILAVRLLYGDAGFYDFSSIVLFTLGGATPTVFAVVLILASRNRKEKRRFWASLVSFKHRVRHWMFALLIPPIIGAGFLIVYAIGRAEPPTLTNAWYWYFYFLAYSLVVGGLEEVGWRGYLQEKLQGSMPLIVVALLVGIVWALWHAPLLFIAGNGQALVTMIPYLVGLFMFSLFITYLYARTGSLFLAIVFHASINATRRMTNFRIVWEPSLITYSLIGAFTFIGIILMWRVQHPAMLTWKDKTQYAKQAS